METRPWEFAGKSTEACNPPSLGAKDVAAILADLDAWVPQFEIAAGRLATAILTRRKQTQRIENLEREVRELRNILVSIPATITTLAPEPYRLLRDIPVVVQPTGDDFVATFFDAGVSATGDNETEAIANLKDMLIANFKMLGIIKPEQLGVSMRNQLAVLRTFISTGE